jgi:hypothetical protein
MPNPEKGFLRWLVIVGRHLLVPQTEAFFNLLPISNTQHKPRPLQRAMSCS